MIILEYMNAYIIVNISTYINTHIYIYIYMDIHTYTRGTFIDSTHMKL